MTTKTEYSARFWDEQLGMFRERRPREVFDPLTGEVRRVAEPRLEVSSPVETLAFAPLATKGGGDAPGVLGDGGIEFIIADDLVGDILGPECSAILVVDE